MVRAVASPTTRRPPADRLAVAVLVLALCLAGVALTPSAAGAGPGTYTNPVSREFADTFADPAVIKAKDGFWYAYGTTDPLREGEGSPAHHPDGPLGRPGRLDLCRRRLHRGDPARLGRPARRRPVGARHPLPGRHLLPVLRRHPDHGHRRAQRQRRRGGHRRRPRPAPGPTPAARWSALAAASSGNPDDFLWTFDPSQFTDLDGTRYLYYGSYYGGIFVTELNDGRRPGPSGEPTHGGHRQPLRGRLRRPPRPLVLPVRLRGQLLRRPDHRLHGVRGPLGQPAGAVHRPRRHLAG